MHCIYQSFHTVRNGARLLTILFLMMGVALAAQTTLSVNTSWQTSSLTNGDLIIPQGTDQLAIDIKGGDGGRIKFNGKTCSSIPGGAGATLKAVFEVGLAAKQLRPGGRLRVFTGQAGAYDEHKCSDSKNFAGGGGGSSAVLYLPPGANIANSKWQVLIIAGGGGGANRPSAGIRIKGFGANPHDWGDDVSYTFARTAGGIGGQCGESVEGYGTYKTTYGGGGYDCGTSSDGDGKRMLRTIDKQYQNGVGVTEIQGMLKDNSEAANTGGSVGKAHGGDGFTGGGSGNGGGGGGGGSSGGASVMANAGGGGGSWLTLAFNTSVIEKWFGGDGAGNNNPGQVRITAINALPFQPLPGGALDVAAGNDGSFWMISDEPTINGNKIYKYNGSAWKLKNGGGIRIDVSDGGIPWLVNSQGDIFRATDTNASSWEQWPGKARDIAVDNDGRPWVIGTNPAGGGYGIFYWTGSQWMQAPGGAVRIGAGKVPWVVNNTNNIYRGSFSNGFSWEEISGQGFDISLSYNGRVYLAGTDSQIWRRDGSSWTPMKVYGSSSVSVSNINIISGGLSRIWLQTP